MSMNPETSVQVIERFNDIGAVQSDLNSVQWDWFFAHEHVLSIQWINRKDCTEKIIRLLKPGSIERLKL